MFVSPLNVPFVFHFFPYSSSNKHIVDLNIFCHRYVLKNLKPGEAVVIVDYKMKLELGMHCQGNPARLVWKAWHITPWLLCHCTSWPRRKANWSSRCLEWRYQARCLVYTKCPWCWFCLDGESFPKLSCVSVFRLVFSFCGYTILPKKNDISKTSVFLILQPWLPCEWK